MTAIEAEESERRGRFFVLDGVDGCGKSTQAKLLVRALAQEFGEEPLHLREPGSTQLGERLRALLLDSEATVGPAAETLLFAAARRQMLDEVVEPALRRGRNVVCERFHASTYAYQAVAGELDEAGVLDLLHVWAGAPAPDLVVLLDLPVADAHERASARGMADRFEARGLEFQRRVADGYRRYAENAERVVVVDARGTAADVAARVSQEVSRGTR